MKKMIDIFKDLEQCIRRALYEKPADIPEQRAVQIEEKVADLKHIVEDLDHRVDEIERSPDPWGELTKSIRGEKQARH